MCQRRITVSSGLGVLAGLIALSVAATSCSQFTPPPEAVPHGKADAAACVIIDTMYRLGTSNKAPSTAQVHELISRGEAADDLILRNFTSDLLQSTTAADASKYTIKLADRCSMMGIGP